MNSNDVSHKFSRAAATISPNCFCEFYGDTWSDSIGGCPVNGRIIIGFPVAAVSRIYSC